MPSAKADPTFLIRLATYLPASRPPRGNGIHDGGNFKAEECRADGDGVAGLLRGVKYLLYAFVISRAPPGVQKIADRIQAKNLLKREGDFSPHDLIERHVENGVLGHNRADSLA